MSDSNPPDETPNDDDPFKEFEDWLVDGPAGEWPEPWDASWQPNPKQRAIIKRNANLIAESDLWSAKIDRFEQALMSLSPPDREQRRKQYELRFDHHVFEADACNFTGRHFVGPVSFAWAKFNQPVIFYKCVFDDFDVDFSEASFGGYAHFENVSFGQGQLSFDRARFSGDGVSFYNSRFGAGSVKFTNSYFASGTVWLGHTSFVDCRVSFEGAQLDNSSIELGHAMLISSDLDFSGIELGGSLSCEWMNAIAASFKNSSIGGIADFSNTLFDSIPDFRQAKIFPPPEVARMRIRKPQLNAAYNLTEYELERRGLSAWTRAFSVAADPEDVLRLRKLKAMAIAANDHERDGEFFAYEMMAKRGTEHTTFWQFLANTIYWKVSFYGQSYLRPLAWMVGTFGVFAAIYTLMAALPIGGWNSLWFGITYSLKNSLPFLGTITRSVPSLDGHTSWFANQLGKFENVQPGLDWLTVLGTGQAILSLIFFFFLLLGLRNRFRLK